VLTFKDVGATPQNKYEVYVARDHEAGRAVELLRERERREPKITDTVAQLERVRRHPPVGRSRRASVERHRRVPLARRGSEQIDHAMSTRPAFHLAFPVTDIEATRRFYGGLLGCPEGRSAARWIDFDFFGHQISAHLVEVALKRSETNLSTATTCPCVTSARSCPWQEWHALAERLRAVRRRVPDRAARALPAARSASRPRCSCSIRAATRWSSSRSRIPRACSRTETTARPAPVRTTFPRYARALEVHVGLVRRAARRYELRSSTPSNRGTR
jgi:extradiol dioxygenase family protein